MSFFDGKVYHLRWDNSLEEFIYQLNRNCRICEYEQKICFIGSSRCEIELKPHKKTSYVMDSFNPDIYITISNDSKALSILITCKTHKGTKIFMLLISFFFILMSICLLGFVLIDNTGKIANPFVFVTPIIIVCAVLIQVPLSRKRVIRDIIPRTDNK